VSVFALISDMLKPELGRVLRRLSSLSGEQFRAIGVKGPNKLASELKTLKPCANTASATNSLECLPSPRSGLLAQKLLLSCYERRGRSRFHLRRRVAGRRPPGPLHAKTRVDCLVTIPKPPTNPDGTSWLLVLKLTNPALKIPKAVPWGEH